MNKPSTLNSLFSIESIQVNDAQIEANVSINADSDIYKAHFPGNPITPGVCQVQLIKNILEIHFSPTSFSLLGAKNIKFTDLLRPEENPSISILLTIKDFGASIMVKSSVLNKEKVFLKANLEFAKND